MSDVPDLSPKDVDLEQLTERAAQDPRVLQQLLDGVSPASKKAAVRHNCSEALMRLAERRPEALLPHWDYLVDLLHSGNGFSQYVAIHAIASLTKVDHEGRFEKALDAFYDLLGDESVMVASHVAGVSGQIAMAQPRLQSEITRRLLGVEATVRDPQRKDLVKGYVVESLGEYYAEAQDQGLIVEFVRKQVAAKSPKTRKAAEAFLRKWKKPA